MTDYINSLISKIETNGCLDEEIEEGYLEYKLRLDRADENIIKKLASQMLWRINEGKNIYNTYKAYYVIGIKDDGKFGYIDREIMDTSLINFKKVCDVANTKIDYMYEYNYETKYYINIIIIKKTISKHLPELNIFLLGNTLTEKSTFLGNLCYDMNGESKLLIHKHKHEINSGKTSSINHMIVGLKNNTIINYRNSSLDFNNSWDKIFNKSDYIINIFDSPGDIKYSKTTYSSLYNINPDIILLFTNYTDIMGSIDSLVDKIRLAIYFGAKIHIIYTINDNITMNHIKSSFKILQNKLISKHIWYFLIKYGDNTIMKDIIYFSIVDNTNSESFCDLKNKLANNIIDVNLIKKYQNNEIYFDIYDIFDIPAFNKNIVLSGKLITGTIYINMELYINHTKIRIVCIHNKNIDCDTLFDGETGCLEIEFIDKPININRYMVLCDKIDIKEISEFIICIDLCQYEMDFNNELYVYCKYFCSPCIVEETMTRYKYKVRLQNSVNICISNIHIYNKCFIKINEMYVNGTIFLI